MKLNLLFIAALTTASAHASPSTFLFQGRNYQLNSLGESTWISPASILARATITKGPNPECARIESELNKLSSTIDGCANASSTVCATIAQSIFYLAEGRMGPQDSPDILAEHVNAWAIADATPVPGDDEILKAAALASGSPTTKFRLNLRPGAKLKSAPRLAFAKESLVSRVARLASFSGSDLSAWNNRGFVTRNTFAACDILAGRAHFSGEAESNLTHTELTPDSVLDPAWKAYGALAQLPPMKSDLSPLAQAATIGYQLGLHVPELGQSVDARLGIAALFTRFYETRDASLKLKDFTSRDSLRTQLFPDQTFRADISYDWSL